MVVRVGRRGIDGRIKDSRLSRCLLYIVWSKLHFDTLELTDGMKTLLPRHCVWQWIVSSTCNVILQNVILHPSAAFRYFSFVLPVACYSVMLWFTCATFLQCSEGLDSGGMSTVVVVYIYIYV